MMTTKEFLHSKYGEKIMQKKIIPYMKRESKIENNSSVDTSELKEDARKFMIKALMKFPTGKY